MNDITALMVTMKAEDISPERMEWLKNLADMKYCASNPGHWLMNLKETNYLAALALQCLENNLTLVEALEKREELRASANRVVNQQDIELQELRQRIADLESRTVTVKLPPRVDSSNVPFTAHTWNCCLDAVEKCLTAAGIQVIEGEG